MVAETGPRQMKAFAEPVAGPEDPRARGTETRQIKIFAEPAIGRHGENTFKNPQLSVETTTLGEIPPEHVRVEMRYVGICGTDVHLVSADRETGLIRTSAACDIPPEGRVIGHEGSGVVIGVGDCVHHVAVGDIVAFESVLSCGQCDQCRRGHANQCRKAGLMGLEYDGLFAEVVDMPATLARNITPQIDTVEDLKAGACLEPAGVSLVACENVGLTAPDVVVVFGAGPIGAYCAMLARDYYGVSKIITVEPLAHRRALARKWSTEVYSVEEFYEADFTFDVLFEAAGNMEGVKRTFRRIEPHGRICLLARSGADLMLDSIDHMITNNIRIVGSRGHLGAIYENILPSIKSRRFPILDTVTRELNGLDQLFEYLKTPERVSLEECKILCRIG